MGFRVVALGRGGARAGDALELGAHVYLDVGRDDTVSTLKQMGGVAAMLSTIGDAATVARLLPTLAPGGQLVLLGAGRDPLPVAMGLMVGGERGIVGSLTGSPFDNEKTLAFSVLAGVRPRFETMPLENANEAYRRMKAGDVRFRMVLTMKAAPP